MTKWLVILNFAALGICLMAALANAFAGEVAWVLAFVVMGLLNLWAGCRGLARLLAGERDKAFNM